MDSTHDDREARSRPAASIWGSLLRGLAEATYGRVAVLFTKARSENERVRQPTLMLNELGCVDDFGNWRQ